MFKGDDLALGVAARNIVDGTRITRDNLEFIERHCVVTVPADDNRACCCCCRDLKAVVSLLVVLGILALIIYYYAAN